MIITTQSTAWIVQGERWGSTPIGLSYDTDHPLTMTFIFPGNLPPTTWLVGRDLVRAGLARPTGQGDVRLWPSRAASSALFLQLRSPAGTALMELDARTVSMFLDRAAFLVPFGSEPLSDEEMDEELRGLLGGAPE